MRYLLLFGAILLAYALVSRRGNRFGLTPPLVFTLIGLGVARFGESLLDPVRDASGVLTVAEATLVLVLFVGATEIDLSAFRKELRLPERLLVVGFPLTFFGGWALAAWLLPDVGPALAALVAIVLTPTDAALGRAVVTNPSVPKRIRQTLNAESGFNDGLAFPVFAFILALAAGTATLGSGLSTASNIGVELAVGLLGVPLGALVGWLGGKAVAWGNDHGFAEAPYVKLSILALPLIAYTGAELIGVNGFLAAFAAGLFFGPAVNIATPDKQRARPRDEGDEGPLMSFAEVEGELLTIVVFVVFGALPLAASLPDIAGRHLLYGLLSLTVARMLPVALSLLGTGARGATVAFVGWFGPRGLGSIVYLLLAAESLGEGPGLSELRATVCATVAMSILLHGATATFLPAWYGRAVEGPASGEPSHGSEAPRRASERARVD